MFSLHVSLIVWVYNCRLNIYFLQNFEISLNSSRFYCLFSKPLVHFFYYSFECDFFFILENLRIFDTSSIFFFIIWLNVDLMSLGRHLTFWDLWPSVLKIFFFLFPSLFSLFSEMLYILDASFNFYSIFFLVFLSF